MGLEEYSCCNTPKFALYKTLYSLSIYCVSKCFRYGLFSFGCRYCTIVVFVVVVVVVVVAVDVVVVVVVGVGVVVVGGDVAAAVVPTLGARVSPALCVGVSLIANAVLVNMYRCNR